VVLWRPLSAKKGSLRDALTGVLLDCVRLLIDPYRYPIKAEHDPPYTRNQLSNAKSAARELA
jgi:hypothetical protein